MSRMPRAWRWIYWSLACCCLALGLCGCSRPAARSQAQANQVPRAIVIEAAYYAPTKSGLAFELDPKAAWMIPVLDAAKAEISARGRAWWHVDVLQLGGTADVSAATGKEQFDAGGREVVSRANTGTNVVYLSRPAPADLAHELGHLWLRSASCADAEAFAAAVLARLERPSARAERGVRALLSGNAPK